MVWLTGGALAICVLMIVGLLAWVFAQGVGTFWPREVVRVETARGAKLMGEFSRVEHYRPDESVFDGLSADVVARAKSAIAARGFSERRLLRTENFELSGTHFTWISDFEVAKESRPEWALVIERIAGGRFYGEPESFRIDGRSEASEPEAIWKLVEEHLPAIRDRVERREAVQRDDLGRLSREMNEARLSVRRAELAHGSDSKEAKSAAEVADSRTRELGQEFESLRHECDVLDQQNARYELGVVAADGTKQTIPLAAIVRAYPANRLGFGETLGIYASRTVEFLTAAPRESNTEGGVMPAIFGTVGMTLIMSILVVPFGVLAALYLREYAKPGPLVSFVRIAVNNLAGVPSIVFGVFGLGFFCYGIGASIDQLFYPERLPSPTFGTGGVLWSALTLALLTLPVVIVPTEEALAAVPSSMREGSYACGATKWQTIRRIVLPRALPGIMTGMILAIARGAGEVAPLMLVGAVKVAPDLPVDGEFPFVHPSRSFMHLGFDIYDLGFQSPNSEAAKPMVFTTTLLLIALVVLLNVIAISVRARLRRKFQGAHV